MIYKVTAREPHVPRSSVLYPAKTRVWAQEAKTSLGAIQAVREATNGAVPGSSWSAVALPPGPVLLMEYRTPQGEPACQVPGTR